MCGWRRVGVPCPWPCPEGPGDVTGKCPAQRSVPLPPLLRLSPICSRSPFRDGVEAPPVSAIFGRLRGGGRGSPPPLTRSLPSRRRKRSAPSGRPRNAAPSGRERLTDWSRRTAHAQRLARPLFPSPFPPTAPPRGRGGETERGRTDRGVLRMLVVGCVPPPLSSLARSLTEVSQRIAHAHPLVPPQGTGRGGKAERRRRAFRFWARAHLLGSAWFPLFLPSPPSGPASALPLPRPLQLIHRSALPQGTQSAGAEWPEESEALLATSPSHSRLALFRCNKPAQFSSQV